MSFPLVHFNDKLVLKTKNGTQFIIYSNYAPPYNAQISLTYSFAKSSDPSDNQITIHGLTRKHAKMFTKGSTVAVYAGWCNSDGTQNNYHLIFKEKITQSATMINEGGDWQTSFTCTDGRSYNKEQSLDKIKSRLVRENSSDRASDRSAISGITKLFKNKRGKLTSLVKDMRSNDVTKRRKALQAARRALTRNTTKERAKVSRAKAKIRSQRDYWISYFKRRDKSLPKRDPSARKALENAKHAKQVKFQNEDAGWTRYSSKISSGERSIRKALQGKSSAITRKSKSISRYSRRRSKSLQRAERSAKTRARGKYERIKRARSSKKSKSVKHKNGVHFKKGTRASAIIMNLAKRAHIHISKLNLVNNKRYTAGYTADKKPEQCIKDIVHDCKSSIWWPNGRLVIGDFAHHEQTPFTLTPETGLIETPQNDQDDDDSGSNDVTQYSVNAIFLPFVTVGSKFKIIDPINSLPDQQGKEHVKKGEFFDDTVIVISGESTIDPGNTPTTQLTVVKASQQAKAKEITVKNKIKKNKDHKDALERKRTKIKRHVRQKARKRK